MDTAGHEGGSILQRLGCWPTVGLFWAQDLHLWRMLLTYITITYYITCITIIIPTSFPGSLFFPSLGREREGKNRDPGNEVAKVHLATVNLRRLK